MSATMQRIWFEMQRMSTGRKVDEDQLPNAAKLQLTDDVLQKVEKTIDYQQRAGGPSQIVLPSESIKFFIVTDWTDRSIRKPGSFSRGAYRVRREPWDGVVQRPMFNVSSEGVTLKAWHPAHNLQLVTKPIALDQFRELLRQMRARELQAAMSCAMAGWAAGEARPAGSKGPSPL